MSCDSACSVALPHDAMGCSAYVIVVLPDHTHLLFCKRKKETVYTMRTFVRNSTSNIADRLNMSRSSRLTFF